MARGLLGLAAGNELTARIGELETSRARVMDAAETERRRIERDLHDGAQQRLVSLAMELGRARAKFGTDPEAAAAIVGQAHEQAKEALAELRNLVRGVHPPVLSDRGLDAALSGLAALSPVPVTGPGGTAGPAARRDRGHRLLRGRRGAHQRGQARPRAAMRRITVAAVGDQLSGGRSPTTASAGRIRPGRACPGWRPASRAWTAGSG